MSTEATVSTEVTAPAVAQDTKSPMQKAAEILDKKPAAPTAEAKPADNTAEKPVEEKKEELVAPKFAALARKERQLVQEREKFKMEQAQREAQWTAKEAEYAKREEKLKAFESIKNPVEALAYLGYSYEEATRTVLNNNKPTAEMEIERLRKELEAKDKAREEAERERQAQTLKEQEERAKKTIETWKSEVNSFIDSHSKEYELVSVNQANDVVIATIEEHFRTTGKILSNTEACDLVEKYLEDQLQKNVATQKWKAKVQPQPKEETQSQSKPAQSAQSQPKTLTNQMSSVAPSFLPAKTEQDRIQRALAALNKG